MKTKILILLLTSYLFIGCDDKDPTIPHKMPPATQEGKNTAGCYINGELFVLSGNRGIQQRNPRVIFNDYPFEGYKYLSIGLSDFNFSKRNINIYIYMKEDGVLKNKVPLLYNSTKEAKNKKEEILIAGARVKSNDFKNEFNLIKNSGNYINFTKIDKQNKILSGTFSFEVKNKKTGEVLKVTDGRFDLKMKYYKN